jgi:hypothetical protein
MIASLLIFKNFGNHDLFAAYARRMPPQLRAWRGGAGGAFGRSGPVLRIVCAPAPSQTSRPTWDEWIYDF